MSILDRGADSIRLLADGSREEAGWLHVDGEPVFHVTRVPRNPPRAWLLLCPAIGGEHDGGYRRQTMLARALLPLGVATRRFHYRGTGNSHVDTATVRDTMLQDASASASDLRQKFPAARRMLLGERVGGLVATETARAVGADELILWHPVTDAEIYARELVRAAQLQLVATGDEDVGGAAEFRAGFDAGEGDLIGFSVSRPLLDSFIGHRLADSEPGPDCHVDLMQFGRKRLDRRYTEVIERWRTSGSTVDAHLLEEPELWWFAPGPWKRGEEGRPVTVEIVDSTVSLATSRLVPT